MACDAAAAASAGAVGPAAETPVATSSGALAHAVVLTGYVVAAVVMTWHLWADPASRAVAGNPWDADLFAWYLRYSAMAISHGNLPALLSGSLNAPQGISMMWNTSVLLPGIVLAPVTLLAGPQASLTLLMTAGFAGSAASLMYVLRRWQFGLWSAALGGAVYAFSPALVQTAVGHYNLQFAVLPPLIIDAGLRLFVVPAGPGRVVRASLRQSLGAGLRLGLLSAAQLFIAEEWLALSALTGLLLAVGLVVARPAAAFGRFRSAVSRLRADADDAGTPVLAERVRTIASTAVRLAARPVAGGAVAVFVMLAVAGIALLTQFAGPLTQHGSPFLVDYYKNDLTVFVNPSGYVAWHSAASALAAAYLPGGAPEQLGYLGWPMIAVLLVAAAALWRDRRVRVLAVIIAAYELLSLGGHPQVHGVTDQAVTLPWHWIESWPIIGLALPDRLSIFADGLVAVLLAILLDRAMASTRSPLWRSARWRRAIIATATIAIAAAVVPVIPLPLQAAAVPTVPAGWSAAFGDLHLAPGARVLLVPIPNAGLTNAMRWQATSGTDISLVGGYFLGPAWNGQAYVDGQGGRPTSNYLDWLWLRTSYGQLAPPVAVTPVAAPSHSELQSDLDYWRPAALVAQANPQSRLAAYLTEQFGAPTVVAGSIMAWRLRGRGSVPAGQ